MGGLWFKSVLTFFTTLILILYSASTFKENEELGNGSSYFQWIWTGKVTLSLVWATRDIQHIYFELKRLIYSLNYYIIWAATFFEPLFSLSHWEHQLNWHIILTLHYQLLLQIISFITNLVHWKRTALHADRHPKEKFKKLDSWRNRDSRPNVHL